MKAVIVGILIGVDQRKITAVMCLDMSQAFDGVNHDILLNKLKTIDLSTLAVLWFQSYLSDRSQAVP